MGIFSYSAAVLSHFDEFDMDMPAVKLEVILLKWGDDIDSRNNIINKNYCFSEMRETYKQKFITFRKLGSLGTLHAMRLTRRLLGDIYEDMH
jgi:hypothetical protein